MTGRHPARSPLTAGLMARFVARVAGPFAVGVLMAACSGVDKPKPTPLQPIDPALSVRPAWSARLGSIGFPLQVAVHGNTVTVANDNGVVSAREADSGRELWRADAGAKLSAGVGSDGRFAAVVTRDNELVAFDGGQPAWRKPLPSRVITAPLVAGERVFVLALDRSVHAFDALDGRKLWTFSRPGDPLTLTQPGVLTAYRDTLVVGQGAKLVGLDPLRGLARWEVTVASPRGTNEVERLADLVGPVARLGDVMCLRAFQAAIGCVNVERAALVWARNTGGIQGVGADEQVMLTADASDRLSAWRREDGAPLWTFDKLAYRDLTAPLPVANTFVVGDSEGVVHWLSRDNGATLLRMNTDGSAVVSTPVRVGAQVLVVTRDGGLFAFRPQ